jgi:hypothetical protein
MHPVQRSFLGTLAEDAAELNRASDCLRLMPDPRSGDPACVYLGLLQNVEHFVQEPDGSVGVSDAPVAFRVHFDEDYCSNHDGSLQFRVARLLSPLFAPNHRTGGILCLGAGLRAGTRLRSVVLAVHQIVSGRTYATDDCLDAEARDYFLAHPERVRALRSPPLVREPVAARVRVEGLPPAAPGVQEVR